MFTRNGVSRAGLVIAGLALGWSSGAHAGAPATPRSRAATVQQNADAARQRAAALASGGGWAYKTGLVDRAQRDAVRYQEEADKAVAEAQACAPLAAPSPAQTAALARLEELRRAGAWAYKTGTVARAEHEVEAQAAPQPMPICGGREGQPRGLTVSSI